MQTQVIHAIESFRFRLRWLLPTACLAGLGEVVGWSARLWSSINPLNESPYIMQCAQIIHKHTTDLSLVSRMSVTIMAPSPLVGALFICFERISERLGEQYGRLPPKLCMPSLLLLMSSMN